jgi:photosystem II stability/assembly factor-like uncharacterized protein
VLAAGSGALLLSNDRGAHWNKVADFDGATAWGSSIDDVFVGGAGVLHSTDHGKTFAKLNFPTNGVMAIWGSDASDVYAVTLDSGASGGQVMHTEDHGQTWKDLQAGLKAKLYAIAGTGPLDVWVAGQGRVTDTKSPLGYHTSAVLAHSVDRGKTWKSVPAAKPGMTENEEIRRLCFTAAGMLVASYSYSVYGTADAGKTWKSLSDVGAEVIGLACHDREILVGARNRNFRRSLDEGATWSAKDLDSVFKDPALITLQAAYVADTGEEYVGGEAYNRQGAGTLLRRAP